MVLRNDRGEFVAGMQRSINERATVLEAEGIGVQEALHWLLELGLRQVVVESDSLIVATALIKNIEHASEVGTTLESCRSILRQRDDFKVQHVRRQANRVAHKLASLLCLLGTKNYFNSPPSCVLESIMYDFPV